MGKRIEVKIKNGTELKNLWIENDESLLHALTRNGYSISSPCSGNGNCGKCKVKIVDGNVPITSEDLRVLPETELADGWRLACTCYPCEDIVVWLNQNEESECKIVSDYDKSIISAAELSEQGFTKQDSESSHDEEYKEYNLAIDLGTTTLAFQLLEAQTGKDVHTVTRLNSQRAYGADVISRIQAAVEGNNEELQECIQKDLQSGIEKVQKECNLKPDQIKNIVIAGNTTMIHLLMGYDCSGLGAYPFAPVNMDLICEPYSEIFQNGTSENEDITVDTKTEVCKLNQNSVNPTVIIFPGISAFVGGDIVSGLYALDFAQKEEVSLFIDLGTNGEMAIGNKEKILTASTAAGPAFEYSDVPWGTGAIELVADLLEGNIIDETGLLADEYFDDGFPITQSEDGKQLVFTQKDIRQLQLAKAAVRAGVEVLLSQFGITAGQVDKVYLAGGFGFYLDVKKAAAIGMIPMELTDKTQAIGNSSLAGCVKYLNEGFKNHSTKQLKDKSDTESIKKIISLSENVELANDKDFHKFYMENMSFLL